MLNVKWAHTVYQLINDLVSNLAQIWRQNTFYLGWLWRGCFYTRLIKIPQCLLQRRRFDQLSLKGLYESQTLMIVSLEVTDISLRCCFSTLAELYKSFNCLVSPLKDQVASGLGEYVCSATAVDMTVFTAEVSPRNLWLKSRSFCLIPQKVISVLFYIKICASVIKVANLHSRLCRSWRHLHCYYTGVMDNKKALTV